MSGVWDSVHGWERRRFACGRETLGTTLICKVTWEWEDGACSWEKRYNVMSGSGSGERLLEWGERSWRWGNS